MPGMEITWGESRIVSKENLKEEIASLGGFATASKNRADESLIVILPDSKIIIIVMISDSEFKVSKGKIIRAIWGE